MEAIQHTNNHTSCHKTPVAFRYDYQIKRQMFTLCTFIATDGKTLITWPYSTKYFLKRFALKSCIFLRIIYIHTNKKFVFCLIFIYWVNSAMLQLTWFLPSCFLKFTNNRQNIHIYKYYSIPFVLYR